MVNYELLCCFLVLLAAHCLTGVPLSRAKDGRTLYTHCNQGQHVTAEREERTSNFKN